MTLGEKIRESRRKQGLSQEQLADRMAVSRSAVAKWETDKGLPDVGNLKILARLLNVSVDHLLDDNAPGEAAVVREPYRLGAYGYGCKNLMKNRVVRDRFPDAAIYSLMGQPEPGTPIVRPIEAPDCRSIPGNPANPADRSFYLVENGERQIFVTVTDSFMEIRPLEQPLQGNRFTMDGWNFIKYNYEIPE